MITENIEESGQNRITDAIHRKFSVEFPCEGEEIPTSITDEEAAQIYEEISNSLQAIPGQSVDNAMQLLERIKNLLKYPVDVTSEFQHIVLSLAFQISIPELQNALFSLAAYLFITRPGPVAELLQTEEIQMLLQLTSAPMPRPAFLALVNFIMSGKKAKIGLFEMGLLDSLKNALELHPCPEHICQILEILTNLLDMPNLEKEFLEQVIEPVIYLVQAKINDDVLVNSLKLLVTILGGSDSPELFGKFYENNMDEYLAEKFDSVRTFCKYKIVEVFINLSGSTRSNTQILIDRNIYAKLLHFVNNGDETVQSYVLNVMRNLLYMGVEIYDQLFDSGLMDFAIDKLNEGDYKVKKASAKFMCGLCHYITDSQSVFDFISSNKIVPFLVDMLESSKSPTKILLGTLRNLAHKAMTEVDELLDSPIFADVDDEKFCDVLQFILDNPDLPYDTYGKHAQYLLGLINPTEEEDTTFIEQLDC